MLAREATYGYASGVILGSPGHVRVAVRPDRASVDYVRPDRSVAHAYAVLVRK